VLFPKVSYNFLFNKVKSNNHSTGVNSSFILFPSLISHLSVSTYLSISLHIYLITLSIYLSYFSSCLSLFLFVSLAFVHPNILQSSFSLPSSSSFFAPFPHLYFLFLFFALSNAIRQMTNACSACIFHGYVFCTNV